MALLHDLPLHPQLFKALDKQGFTEATAVQEQAIPAILSSKDVMVSAKTGSGKTAAFFLPILDYFLNNDAPKSSTRALVLVPTRELALQLQKAFEQLAAFTYIKSGVIIGGEAFKHQVAMIRKNPEVLIATPGRLVEHVEKGTTDLRDLEFLILDEADRMLDMGFSEDMNTIAKACKQERQNCLFSATLNHKNLHRIKDILVDPVSIKVDSQREGHTHIQQEIILCDEIKHKEKIVSALIEQEKATKIFIFCNTRAQCQQLGNLLKYKKLKVDFIHGEIAQSDRKQVMNRFRSGSVDILVATDVAARGLDIENVDLVINFTVAQSGNDHVHRIGRTGRAGQEGKAITLVSDFEWNQMSSIERYLKIRFKKKKVKGLEAKYSGPKKVKSSGKAAGSKKKKTENTNGKAAKGKAGAKAIKTKKYSNQKPKKEQASSNRDGFSALRKKK